MSEARLPVAVTTSILLHGGMLAAYLHFATMNAKQQSRIIGNVDLLIKVRRTPTAGPVKPPPPSTFDFLKLALPALPKMELKAVAIKAPEIKRPLAPMTPKLDDRGKRAQLDKLEALDLDSKRPDMAKIEAKLETHKAALANTPRLEEVGRRQVRNLPQALAIEERRQEAVQLKQLESMGVPSSRHGPAAMEALQEAAAPQQRSRFMEKLAAALPEQEDHAAFQPEMRRAPESIDRKLNKFVAPPLERSREAAPVEKKKSVEIEGPLADRKIVSYVVPEFPAWARSQGILEASVAIRFYVDKAGSVIVAQMRVERTSGYGRLDRLAMDALKDWKFAPLALEQKQWGIITFTFVLE